MEHPLSVGLIGYGPAGAAFHAPLIATTAGLRLAAIVTANPERVRQAEHEHPAVAVLDAAERLWERADQLDLVVIASPNRTHVPLALAALDAGLPVVVDKPIAPTAAEARHLILQARERDVMLTVFQNRRWDGDFLTLQRLLQEGVLGRVSRFESRFERWRPIPKGGWRERSAPEEAGGLLYDLGSHLIDQAVQLFGPVRRVYAELDRRREGIQVDDDAFVAMEHFTGTRSHLWMSAVAPQLGPRFRVLGSAAAYTKYGLDPQEDALRGGDRPGTPAWGEEPAERWGLLGAGDQIRPHPTEAGAYPRFYAGVFRALQREAPPPVDPADAVAALEVIEAARRSAAVNQVVGLSGAPSR